MKHKKYNCLNDYDMTMLKALSFDDITLVPLMSRIKSRMDVKTDTKLSDIELKTPIISASMDTITESEMCLALRKAGALGCMHRFMSIDKNVNEFLRVKNKFRKCIVSIGTKEEEFKRFEALQEAGALYFSIDIAHGHSSSMEEMIKRIRKSNRKIKCLIGGNVATAEGVKDLAEWGVDIVKCGIGGGSVCSTRIVSGHGIPQFSAIIECGREAKKHNVKLIADGAIKTSGDIIKSFVAGADFVMCGSLLAGTLETPGEIIDGKKVYRGMSSKDAIKFAKNFSTFNPAPEGISTKVDFKGNVANVIQELTLGLRSGMTYCDAITLTEIYEKAKWMLQTPMGKLEGNPHILG